MKKINELWDELTNHPDYVTGNLWTVEDVASNFEYQLEVYLENKFNYQDIDYSQIERYSFDIIKENKEQFKNTIDNFESYSYKHGTWDISIEKLILPECEVNEAA